MGFPAHPRNQSWNRTPPGLRLPPGNQLILLGPCPLSAWSVDLASFLQVQTKYLYRYACTGSLAESLILSITWRLYHLNRTPPKRPINGLNDLAKKHGIKSGSSIPADQAAAMMAYVAAPLPLGAVVTRPAAKDRRTAAWRLSISTKPISGSA